MKSLDSCCKIFLFYFKSSLIVPSLLLLCRVCSGFGLICFLGGSRRGEASIPSWTGKETRARAFIRGGGSGIATRTYITLEERHTPQVFVAAVFVRAGVCVCVCRLIIWARVTNSHDRQMSQDRPCSAPFSVLTVDLFLRLAVYIRECVVNSSTVVWRLFRRGKSLQLFFLFYTLPCHIPAVSKQRVERGLPAVNTLGGPPPALFIIRLHWERTY